MFQLVLSFFIKLCFAIKSYVDCKGCSLFEAKIGTEILIILELQLSQTCCFAPVSAADMSPFVTGRFWAFGGLVSALRRIIWAGPYIHNTDLQLHSFIPNVINVVQFQTGSYKYHLSSFCLSVSVVFIMEWTHAYASSSI